MITVTQQEHKDMVASAEATLIAKCLNALCSLKKGEDVDVLSQPISVAYCNLISLEVYKTSEFDPESYFNVMDPTHLSGSFSNVNTINTIQNG